MEALDKFFERCYVINLDRRPDRWKEFQARFAGYDWPFVTPERFPAVDGKKVPWPRWWGQGGGSWGVYRSNLKIIEKCLMEDVQSVLVLEDDATLECPNDEDIHPSKFRERMQSFIEHVPHDWEQIYLGGQHLFKKQSPPKKFNEHVVIPYNVNRLHAYGLSRKGMEVAFRHLTDNRWQQNHHIDHHFGQLRQRGGIKVYAPPKWLVGQGNSKSDICGRELQVRFWNGANRAPNQIALPFPPVIAVLGPYRGGTSCVAGAMHKMGIIMGHKFFVGNASGQAASPKGCFEAQRLFNICNQCYPEPQFVEGKPYKRRVQMLRNWLGGRKREKPVVGAKHPKLCLMIPEMLDAWPECKFVVVHRPVEQSAASLKKLGWWRNAWQPEELVRKLVAERDEGLKKVAEDRQYHVQFEEIIKDPRPVMETIAVFAGVKPSEEQFQMAVEHVSPELKHQ